jgi:hypothetical protein
MIDLQGHTTMIGLHCRLKPEALDPPYRTEEFLTVFVYDGFGATPGNIGTGVFVTFSDGDNARFAPWHFERIATPEEVIAAGFPETHGP